MTVVKTRSATGYSDTYTNKNVHGDGLRAEPWNLSANDEAPALRVPIGQYRHLQEAGNVLPLLREGDQEV